jgi:cobalamin biosynthesis Mg chelatase CobN
MRKLFLIVAIGLLCTTFAVAQASSSPQSAQQPSAQSSQSAQPSAQQPSQPPADQGAARSDRSTAKPDSDAARSQADQSATPSDRQAADQGAAQPGQQPQRASNGGVPWGWIVLGIVIVAIILALIGRGTDTERVDRERVETINRSDRDVVIRDRRDDDIRRVG